MTLLERFIEVNGWSTSRKTVLLCAITLPAHLLGWAVLFAAHVDTHVVNMVIVHGVVAFGAVALVVCLRILPLDAAACRIAGQIADKAVAAGNHPGLPDVATAALSKQHGLRVLTGNVRHFKSLGVPYANPFEGLPAQGIGGKRADRHARPDDRG